MARAYEVPLAVMRGVAFAIGSLVVALTTYSAIVDRRREYGIVKAMGADGRRLLQLAVGQTVIVTAIGLVVGGVLFVVARAPINDLRPQFIILAPPGNVARATASGAPLAPTTAVLPTPQTAPLEPTATHRR